jgi:hypothetical protein
MWNPLAGNDGEFLEFKNVGNTDLDLSGASLLNAVSYTFPQACTFSMNNFAIKNI